MYAVYSMLNTSREWIFIDSVIKWIYNLFMEFESQEIEFVVLYVNDNSTIE